jgi:branched-subunit amino acid ABC-type transport system permease component
MDAEFIARQLLNGLSLSVILALIALGLSVIFGLMRILNMAHGEFFILGGYGLLWVTSIGLTFWLGLVAAPLAVGVLGFALYQGLLRRLAASFTAGLLATWGLSIIIRQLIQIVAGPRPYSVDEPFSGSISIGGLQYPAYRAFIIVAGIAILGGTVLLYYRTSFGLQIRAAIHDREMAVRSSARSSLSRPSPASRSSWTVSSSSWSAGSGACSGRPPAGSSSGEVRASSSSACRRSWPTSSSS